MLQAQTTIPSFESHSHAHQAKPLHTNKTKGFVTRSFPYAEG